jgi:hypothetical protein
MAPKHPQKQNQSFSRLTTNFQHSNHSCGIYCGRGHSGCFNSHNHGPSNSVKCQVCFKPGHIAWKCYHRFNFSYQDQQATTNQPQAMVVAHYQHNDNEWHPDIGATHYLTNNVNNIHLQNEDNGSQDHIQVANGVGLKIIQSGTSTLSSHSKTFVLDQILLALNIQKIFLFVHCFYLDNNVFFEFQLLNLLLIFHSLNYYLGNILHRGPFSNAHYNFSTSYSSSATRFIQCSCVCQYLASLSRSCFPSSYK